MARSRRQFWIDTPLQLRILFFVLTLIAVSLLLAYLAASRGLEQAASQADRAFVSVSWAESAMRLPFAIAAATALIAGALITFVWAHRIVGPLMVLTAGLKRLADGDLSRGLELRDSDLRWETTEQFERLRSSLRAQAARLAELERQLRVSSAHDGELKSIRKEMAELADYFKL